MNNSKNEVERNSRKKHRFLRAILKIILFIVIVIVLFVGGFIGYSTFKNGWGLKGMIKTAVGATSQSPEELGEFQVLILGISEDISSKLTDTIIVASYNPATQKAVLLSIPRDTFVGNSKLRADSYDKVNAVYQVKGPEGVLDKVNKLTGLNIKNYIVISNNALVELVDTIGGVYFEVPTNMKYDSSAQDLHIDLKKGYQKLTGEQSEWLVRFRKNNDGTTYSGDWGSDDYGRMKTQREFLKAVAKQTISAQNILKVGELIDIVKRNVTTNINNWDEIKEYIPYAVEFDTDNLLTDVIPGDSERIPAGTGLWFFLPFENQTKKLVEDLFVTQNTTVDTNIAKERSKIKIELLNGSGDNSKLEKAEKKLKEQGFKIENKKETTSTANTTIINKSQIKDSTISEIKNILETGIVSEPSTKKAKVDITIIIGKDYK